MDQQLFSDAGIPLTSADGGPPYDSRSYRENPYPWYAWHRTHRPVLTTQFEDAYLGLRRRHYFFRHADVRALLSDPRLGRQTKIKRAEQVRDAVPPAHQTVLDLAKTFFTFKDPPDHTRVRRAIALLFDSSRLKPLEEEVLAQGHRILRAIGTNTDFDVIADFVIPLITETVAGLIGVARGSPSELYADAHAVVRALGGGLDDARMRAGAEAVGRLHVIVEHALAAGARGGWAGELVAALGKDLGLRADELVATLIFLLIAAVDTTVNGVGNVMATLCRDPACWRRLRNDPKSLPNAIGELMRLESAVQSMERYPLQPFDYAGIELVHADTVVLMLGSANRDERVFPNPDILDLDRPRGVHATFGFGIHGCPGAFLARMLATIALQVLTSRFESVVCAEAATATEWRPMVVFRGPAHLRIRGMAVA